MPGPKTPKSHKELTLEAINADYGPYNPGTPQWDVLAVGYENCARILGGLFLNSPPKKAAKAIVAGMFASLLNKYVAQKAAAKDRPLEPDDKVVVYQKPFTDEDREGVAVLVGPLDSSKGDEENGTERWRVRFLDERGKVEEGVYARQVHRRNRID